MKKLFGLVFLTQEDIDKLENAINDIGVGLDGAAHGKRELMKCITEHERRVRGLENDVKTVCEAVWSVLPPKKRKKLEAVINRRTIGVVDGDENGGAR